MARSDVDELLDRGREELEVARALLDGGHERQAASRAYYAAFYAAEAALLSLDETRSKHSGVIAAFTERLAKPGEVPRELARSLQDLFALRTEADYGYRSIPAERAAAALDSATRFVHTVGDWVHARRADA